jgi:hypothetical protein
MAGTTIRTAPSRGLTHDDGAYGDAGRAEGDDELPLELPFPVRPVRLVPSALVDR